MPLLLGSASSYTRLVVTYGYFLLNDSTLLFKLLTLLCGALVLACSEEYLRNHARHTLEYSIFVALALFFMLLLVCANNMISSFFALVGFSLNLYILILYDLVSKPSREAGLKYFYLSTLSSGLFIYGAFLFYAAMSTGDFDVLAYGFASVDGTSKDLLRVGTLLLIFGLFFKLSAVPGHL
jgi:NADH-quinone oxidoreductase subunit N